MDNHPQAGRAQCIDTGAEVTAISDKTYQDLNIGKLVDPEKILYGPPMAGQFQEASRTREKLQHNLCTSSRV